MMVVKMVMMVVAMMTVIVMGLVRATILFCCSLTNSPPQDKKYTASLR